MAIKVTRLRTFSTPWKQKLKISTCCLWNRINPGAGEYTWPAVRNVGKSLIPNDSGDVNLHTWAIDQAWGQNDWILAKFSFACFNMHQSNPNAPCPLPRATAEHLPTLSVPTLANFAWPGGRAFAHPGANPELLIILIFRPLHRWTESEQNEILKVNKWTMMASCSRSQFSPSLLQPRFLFSNNFYSSRLLNYWNTILKRERRPLKNKQL